VILPLVLLASAAIASPSRPPAGDARVTSWTGKVEVLRAGKILPAEKDLKLRRGDLVRSAGHAWLRTAHGRLELGPQSALELEDPGASGAPEKLFLRYGNLRVVASAEPGLRLHTPGFVASLSDGDVLAHVARDQGEFGRVLAGSRVPAPATERDLDAVEAGPRTFSQLGCLAGSATATLEGPERVAHVGAGQLLRAVGHESADGSVTPGLEELRGITARLGLERP
jgi:hypothetical protein